MAPDLLAGCAAAARGVLVAQPLVVADRLGHHREHPGVDLGSLGERRVDGRGPQRLGPAAEPVGQHLHHLRQRREGRLAEPAGQRARRTAEGDDHRDRLVLVDDQGRHGAALRELVAALDAAGGVDRVAEIAQPLDVAAQRSVGDLQPLGQLPTGPEAVGLEQRQQPQGARARVRHVPRVSHIAVRK